MLFRNPEARRGAIACAVLSLILTAAAFLADIKCGVAAAICCAALDVAFLLIMRRRYVLIREMTSALDGFLHGSGELDLDRFSEGELSILNGEISKLTTALRQQADELRREKLRLADALADISHQLKTPLTSMNLALSMLSDPRVTEERRLELTREVASSLSRVEWLVSSLLKLSRFDADAVELKLERVELSTLLERSVSPIAVAAEVREVELAVDAGDNAAFTGDLFWTTEAVGNLIKNCVEHTPPGGTVTVSGRENALYTEITVSDTGAGFDKADLPHLFDRFYRGKNAAADSVGVGLALARAIITKEGGAIKAENARSGGALFTVRFYKSSV